jgi:hypothetical protein
VNGKSYIAARGNYIPKFTTWNYFFPEIRHKKMKAGHSDTLSFYFIGREDENKPVQEIATNKLYKIVHLKADEVKENQINRIFYYGDSIVVSHIFDLETR